MCWKDPEGQQCLTETSSPPPGCSWITLISREGPYTSLLGLFFRHDMSLQATMEYVLTDLQLFLLAETFLLGAANSSHKEGGKSF